MSIQQTSEYSLEIEHLVKKYGSLVAVNDISLKVPKGAFFAFLGINGAGKSTTINVICSILRKDGGKVYVDGKDLDTDFDSIKNEIGVVYQNSVLDLQLSVLQNLKIRSSFYLMSKKERQDNINYIIDLLELEPILHKPISQLSGGQKRRVDIARAMVHNPKLLILDEPTTGLDPKTRKIVWNLINKIRNETKMTVFLTTHYLEEAEKATFVTIMNKGQIIAEGTPLELKNLYAKDYLLAYGDKDTKLEEYATKVGVPFYYSESKGGYKLYYSDKFSTKEAIKSFDKYVHDFEILKGTMDDVFLKVTNNDITTLEEGINNEK